MDSEQREGIGQVVRTLREASGLSREALSRATAAAGVGRPVSADMIAKIEQGRKGPSAASLASIAHGLGIDTADLAGRAHAWQAAAAAGVGVSALRTGTVAGALTGAVTSAFFIGGAPAAAAVGAAAAVSSRRSRQRTEKALRDRVANLDNASESAMAAALDILGAPIDDQDR